MSYSCAPSFVIAEPCNTLRSLSPDSEVYNGNALVDEAPKLSRAAKRQQRLKRSLFKTVMNEQGSALKPPPGLSSTCFNGSLRKDESQDVADLADRLHRLEILLFRTPEPDFVVLDAYLTKLMQDSRSLTKSSLKSECFGVGDNSDPFCSSVSPRTQVFDMSAGDDCFDESQEQPVNEQWKSLRTHMVALAEQLQKLETELTELKEMSSKEHLEAVIRDISANTDSLPASVCSVSSCAPEVHAEGMETEVSDCAAIKEVVMNSGDVKLTEYCEARSDSRKSKFESVQADIEVAPPLDAPDIEAALRKFGLDTISERLGNRFNR